MATLTCNSNAFSTSIYLASSALVVKTVALKILLSNNGTTLPTIPPKFYWS